MPAAAVQRAFQQVLNAHLLHSVILKKSALLDSATSQEVLNLAYALAILNAKLLVAIWVLALIHSNMELLVVTIYLAYQEIV